MKLLELPNTPRAAYEALSGKRPDLLVNAVQGSLRFGTVDLSVLKLEDCPAQVAVLAGTSQHPMIVLLGGCN